MKPYPCPNCGTSVIDLPHPDGRTMTVTASTVPDGAVAWDVTRNMVWHTITCPGPPKQRRAKARGIHDGPTTLI